jgi:hypothetical protein
MAPRIRINAGTSDWSWTIGQRCGSWRAAGATLLGGDFLDFFDPWGNRVEVVEYLTHLKKSDHARKQLADKAMK